VADQQFISGNLGLAAACDMKRPIHVTRGYKLKSMYAPAEGYRYDGCYYVENYWSQRGKNNFVIYRFRLVRLEDQNPLPIAINKPKKSTKSSIGSINQIEYSSEDESMDNIVFDGTNAAETQFNNINNNNSIPITKRLAIKQSALTPKGIKKSSPPPAIPLSSTRNTRSTRNRVEESDSRILLNTTTTKSRSQKLQTIECDVCGLKLSEDKLQEHYKEHRTDIWTSFTEKDRTLLLKRNLLNQLRLR
jgi:hypothetical protein